MKKFLLFLIIPAILSCSKLGELTNKNDDSKKQSTETNGKTETVSEIQPGENTYGVIAGVLEWSDKDFAPFEKRNRKDKEFYELLRSKGAGKNIKLLLDDEATLKNMKREIESALESAPEGSTFLFYYAGHGVKDQKTNLKYFANSDIRGSDYEGSGFSVKWLGDVIKNKFKGKLVWLMADCCYSGALLEEVNNINSAGKNVIAITSASSCNISTANWTYSQTMIDCFSGLPLADRNEDGVITLKETADELKDAMKFREHQLSGYQVKSIDENAEISKTEGVSPYTNSNNFAIGSYHYAAKNGNWQVVRIVDRKRDKLISEFYDYSDKSIGEFTEKELRPVYFVSHKAGDNVKVEWEGNWYGAKIVDSDNNFYFIKYDGYDDSWNEWVAYDRIRTGKEKAAQVEWQGAWFPALVHEDKDGKYFISYSGYAYTWDEWVGENRIKF